jgi:hypothetical protein
MRARRSDIISVVIYVLIVIYKVCDDESSWCVSDLHDLQNETVLEGL